MTFFALARFELKKLLCYNAVEGNMSTLIKEKHFLTDAEQKAVSECVDRIREALGESLITVKMLGSKARGGFDSESDIDLFILVKERTVAVMHVISGIAAEADLKYDTNLSPVIFSLFEFKQNTALETSFVKNLQKDGIPLYG